MSVFLFILAGGLFTLLIVLAAARPPRAAHSLYELRRRQHLRDKNASDELRRQALLGQASVLYTPLLAVLLVSITALLIYLLGWTAGLAGAFAVALLYGRIASIPLVKKLANKVYRRNEQRLLGVVSKYKKATRAIGGKRPPEEHQPPIGSKEELLHLMESSPMFSDDDKQLLENTLRFRQRTVGELMTPKSKVVTVADSELLGPLVLDDLHKSGHTIFPVVKDEAVVGLLDSRDHIDLHTKESVYVRSVMHTDVPKINETATLSEALEVFIRAKESLLIVVDSDGQMVGIVSLSDIVQALVGVKHR